MLSKRATGNNGHSKGLPPVLVDYVPEPLRKQIERAFEEEGMMEQSAERRILEALNANHKETQAAIHGLEGTLHLHDKRLTLVENTVTELKEVADDVDTLKTVAKDVALLNKAAETAATERNKMAWLVKGSIAAAIMSIITGALVTVYGTKAPVVQEVKEAKQEVKQETSELTQQMKELIQVLKVKAGQEATPARAATPRSGRSHSRPEPVPAPQINLLTPGELIAPRDHEPPRLGYNNIPLLEMKVPD